LSGASAAAFSVFGLSFFGSAVVSIALAVGIAGEALSVESR